MPLLNPFSVSLSTFHRALQELTLYDNNLRGSIPSELGVLERLRSFSVHDNTEVLGSIPTELGILSNLRDFWAFNCALS